MLDLINGMKVIHSKLLPEVAVEYRYLWPVVGGHVWVMGKAVEYDVFVIDGNIHIHPSMEAEFLRSLEANEIIRVVS